MPARHKVLGAYARLIVAVGLSVGATILGFLISVSLDALASQTGLHGLTEGTAMVVGLLLPMLMPIACFLTLYLVVRPSFRRSGQGAAWRAGAMAIIAANLMFFVLLIAPQGLASSEADSEFLVTLFWLGLVLCINSVLGVVASYLFSRFLSRHKTGTES